MRALLPLLLLALPAHAEELVCSFTSPDFIGKPVQVLKKISITGETALITNVGRYNSSTEFKVVTNNERVVVMLMGADEEGILSPKQPDAEGRIIAIDRSDMRMVYGDVWVDGVDKSALGDCIST
jgi:hypothetical protein